MALTKKQLRRLKLTASWRVFHAGWKGTFRRADKVKLSKGEKKAFRKQRTRDALSAQGLL